MPERDDFFIGYEPPLPPRLARFVRVIAGTAACLAAIWGLAAGAVQPSAAGGRFEFGHPRVFTGTVIARPYPALRLDRVEDGDSPVALLVATGKHGADALIAGFNGQRVSLMGTRIQREGPTMIEVRERSIQRAEPREISAPAAPPRSAGAAPIDVAGEIVDAKCFLGVMVPGEGKAHKDCAALCLRGGIPAALHVVDRHGASALLLITDDRGEPDTRAARFAGEAVLIHGQLIDGNGWPLLQSARISRP